MNHKFKNRNESIMYAEIYNLFKNKKKKGFEIIVVLYTLKVFH